jgi:hypothetical protein
MRKLISTMLVVMLVFSGCSQKETKTTVLTWGTGYSVTPEFLKGNIKEVIQNSFWATVKDGKVEKGALMTLKNYQDSGWIGGFHAAFNDAGKLIRCDYFGDNQTVDWSIANDFKDGRVEKENWIRKDTVFANSYFHYNEKGFPDSVRMVNALADTSNQFLVMVYDEKGNITRQNILNSKGILQWHYIRTNTDEGRVTKLVYYYQKNDSIQFQQIYTYNDHGFCDSNKGLDKKNKLVIDLTGNYTYDDKGNWITTVWSKNGKPWAIDERSYIYY